MKIKIRHTKRVHGNPRGLCCLKSNAHYQYKRDLKILEKHITVVEIITLFDFIHRSSGQTEPTQSVSQMSLFNSRDTKGVIELRLCNNSYGFIYC